MTYLAGMKFCFNMNYQDIDIQAAESYLRKLVSDYSDLIFGQKTEVLVELEEGSLKATLIVAGAIYIGIGQYGSFRSGIDYLIKDAKSLRELVTSRIVKIGVNELDILESKKVHCDPDKIRRLLLAIEKHETNRNISTLEAQKDISKISNSLSKLCLTMNKTDVGLLATSVDKKYWPNDRELPDCIERYNIVAREEDVLRNTASGIDRKRANNGVESEPLPQYYSSANKA